MPTSDKRRQVDPSTCQLISANETAMKPGTAKVYTGIQGHHNVQPCMGQAAVDSRVLQECSLMCFSLKIGVTATASLLSRSVPRQSTPHGKAILGVSDCLSKLRNCMNAKYDRYAEVLSGSHLQQHWQIPVELER